MMVGARRRFLPVWCLVLGSVGSGSTPAAAQECIAPPGTAAVEQYCETQPAAGGTGRSGRAEQAPAVPAATVRELQRAGTEGQELSRLIAGPIAEAESRAGKPRARIRKDKASREYEANPPARQAVSGDPLSAVRSAVDTGDVLGGTVAWILVTIAAAMGGAAWARHRRGSE